MRKLTKLHAFFSDILIFMQTLEEKLTKQVFHVGEVGDAKVSSCHHIMCINNMFILFS